MKIQYNAPVVLSLALASTVVLVADALLVGHLMPYFTVGPVMNFGRPVDYLRLFSYVLGHAGVGHLISNMMLILLLGPILEEKYGSKRLLLMILITAVVTGALNLLLFRSGLLGASGVVFMMILLASVTNVRRGSIPLTFVLVVLLYLGQEVFNSLRNDSVSQFAHVIGGLCGAAFGLLPGWVSQRRGQ